ncbi:MAG: hypothetical protein JWL76_1427 [Thermoleophilia bacterium]|nr:hypothetical protein [Thermoleophilia bacterium]
MSTTLVRRDVKQRWDIPVTSVERTIVDLGDVLTAWQLANVLHEAEFRRRLSLWELDRVIARNPGAARARSSVVRSTSEPLAAGGR